MAEGRTSGGAADARTGADGGRNPEGPGGGARNTPSGGSPYGPFRAWRAGRVARGALRREAYGARRGRGSVTAPLSGAPVGSRSVPAARRQRSAPSGSAPALSRPPVTGARRYGDLARPWQGPARPAVADVVPAG
ncbi:hypothetical protein Sdia_30290 [Streptomyces diastaticus subsp. diastaticus]|uniref:Uncharacterized protein n=1 Tax=Streptomyces diastaticus subsp. diastaticus TaxID=68040 RepID=A0ABQ1CPG1_STRDI|nr:hypothetical protein Sdia_30290 [Streptomyces diastaticus subsp. diastaticus]GGU26900.1 hypothetical protein GCM10015534_31900 [Streptomyces diastaticus subsp. diastaticus]